MPKKEVPEEVREFFRKIAEAGDYPSKGGAARAENLTAEERSAIAKKAGKASAIARAAKKKSVKKVAKKKEKLI